MIILLYNNLIFHLKRFLTSLRAFIFLRLFILIRNLTSYNRRILSHNIKFLSIVNNFPAKIRFGVFCIYGFIIENSQVGLTRTRLIFNHLIKNLEYDVAGN